MTTAARRPRLLFLGAFAPPSVGRVGGVQMACRALAASSLSQHCELILIDGTALRVPPPPLPVRAWGALKRAAQFIRLLHRESPDAVLLFTSAGLSFAEKGVYAVIGAAYGLPVLLWQRDGRFIDECRRSALWRAAAGVVVDATASLVCQGESWSAFYQDTFGVPASRCAVIESWLAEEDLFAIGAARTERPDTAPVRILFMGWLERHKGIYDLLDAVTALRAAADVPPFRLLVAGDGAERAGAEAVVAARSLEALVEFRGWLLGPGKQAVLAEADLFVLPSYREGLPNAMMEAMAAGLPPVVTPVGATADVLERDVDALVVEAGDVAALTAALRRLLTDPVERRRMGRAAFTTASRRFRVERAAGQLLAVLTTATNGGTR